ncbi:MAG TPA: M12 family metallopeptidase [Chthoniobacterales bacterium]
MLRQAVIAFIAVLTAGAGLANDASSLPMTGTNAWDIAVIDRALAKSPPDEPFVVLGDIGVKRKFLEVFRARLIAEREGRSLPGPDADTPPGMAFKWPGGMIPYRFDPTQVSNGTITAVKMQQFRDSVTEWTGFANVQFSEFTGGTPTNFVTVQEDPSLGGGFSSSVGMAGGEQFVKFGPNAWNRGTICHENGHVLGYYHEQQRDDRDTFVTILTQNIIPGQEGNFAKLPGGSTAIGPYDFYSVMHYARNALSIDPDLDTIEPQPPYSQFLDIMGQVYYRTLSKLDRAGMASIYGNPAVLPSATVTNTKDSGTGSLRSALYFAFDKSTDVPPVPTTVSFHIPTSDPGFANNVFTIQPSYLLVAPGAGTTVDGATQTAFTGNTNPNGPEVVVNGAQITSLGVFAPGLDLREANCAIKNLVINGFNENGILIEGTGATGNAMSGCYIGTNATGTAASANTFPGIEIISGAHNNTVGGTTATARNVISGNAHIGVSIHDTGTNSNLVEGNFIGTNATGNAALPNTYQGVAVFEGAQSNVIGGTTASARNIIAGNNLDGIAFLDAGTNANLVEGNYIGLNAAGSAALPNVGAGVAIVTGAQSNIVGSATSAGGRNVISGNTYQGVVIVDPGTTLNSVVGNLIGMNPAGTASLGNGGGGVDIFGAATANTIGGTSNVASNFISGNGASGIDISGTGTNNNKVLHNFIGTTLSGSGAVPNNAGVQIFSGAQKNTIGGTTASARNVISGNHFQGVTISGTGTKSNTVAGNYIGTNKTGSAALPNETAGLSIFLGAQANVVGGPAATSRNVISGNLDQGVTITDTTTSQNQVVSNYIGVTAAGTAALANGFSGIDIFAAPSNIVGGVGKGNLVSGNLNWGIVISGTGATANNVQGNLIGTDPTGTTGIANAFSGMALFNAAQNNLIGSSTTGAGNVIAFNVGSGIDVFDSTTIGNDFNANSIFSNGGLGINLVGGSENGFGVTANDLRDPDAGPNQLQNFPVLTSANSSAVIQGSLNSVPRRTYRVDFYSSPSADSSGNGEGKTWIGSVSLTTDASGNATFNQDFSASLAVGSVVAATATGTGRGVSGTSEFSANVTVVP